MGHSAAKGETEICSAKGCRDEAALGGVCESHGGVLGVPGGWVLFGAWPDLDEAPEDARWHLGDQSESARPFWCVARSVWDRWAVAGLWRPAPEPAPGFVLCRPAVPRPARRGGKAAPQRIPARAARQLVRAGRVNLIALHDQIEASAFVRALAGSHLDVLPAAVPLVTLASPLPADGAAALAGLEGVELLPELAALAAEPEPLPWRPWGWGQPRRRAPGPPSERAQRLPLDAYAQHPEWQLPEALIDSDAEDRMIKGIDLRRRSRPRQSS